MRGITMIVILASFAQAYGNGLAGNQIADSQDSADDFVNKLADRLIDRTLADQDADLDDTTLGKPGQLLSAKAKPMLGQAVPLHPGPLAFSPPRITPFQSSSLLGNQKILVPGDIMRPKMVIPGNVIVNSYKPGPNSPYDKEALRRRAKKALRLKLERRRRRNVLIKRQLNRLGTRLYKLTLEKTSTPEQLREAASILESAVMKAGRKYIIPPNRARRKQVALMKIRNEALKARGAPIEPQLAKN